MAKAPRPIGNSKVVGSTGTEFAGPSNPAREGAQDVPKAYQAGLPVQNGMSQRMKGSTSYVPGKVHELGPNFGPDAKPSDPV